MSRVIDAVILDLDGVLVDSQPAALKATIDTLAEYGIDLTDSEVREQVGGGTRKYLRFFLEKELDLDQVDECIGKATDRKDNLQMGYTDRVALLLLAKRILIRLNDNGYSIALAAMSARNVGDRILDYHKFEDYFNVIMTTGDLVNRKPDLQYLGKRLIN